VIIGMFYFPSQNLSYRGNDHTGYIIRLWNGILLNDKSKK